MRAIYELYQLMPGKGCGVCGNISCRQYARRLLVGEERLEKCRYLSTAEMGKVKTLLKEGVETHRKLPAQDELFVVQPCLSNSKKIMVDSRIGVETKYGVMDTFEMCRLTRNCALFTKQKCSEKLGIATFEFENKEIVVYDNGKISIKQADSREDALAAIMAVEKLLYGSFLCPDCGGSAIDCAKGFCNCGMQCKLLGDGSGKPEIEIEKLGTDEIERAGLELLTGKNIRTGIALIALAECVETLAKAGTEETERIVNNQTCVKKMKKKLEQF